MLKIFFLLRDKSNKDKNIWLAFSAFSLGISQDYLCAGQMDASTDTYWVDIFLQYLECQQAGQSCAMWHYFPARQQHPCARHWPYSQLRSHPKALTKAPVLAIWSILTACLWSGSECHWDYTMGSSFSDKTSDSCWKMSHNDQKQQAK